MIKIWVAVLIAVGALLVGLIAGFFAAKAWFKHYLKKNPPITEKMVREMMSQMGRKPSEKQVRAVMASIQKNQ